MRIAIVGAGVTGLAAAYDLSKNDHDVVIYDRAPFLGGQASTFEINGTRLERGYHHLFQSDIDIIELMEEIDLGHKMRWIDSKVGTLYDGKIYNFVTPIDLLKFKPLKFPDRIRLGLVTLIIQRIKNWRNLESITAVDWLKKWVGQGAFEGFWGPMLRGKFGDNYYKEVGMAWIWGKIATRFSSRSSRFSREQLGYPIGSFGEICDVLAEKITQRSNHINLSSRVVEIRSETTGGVELKIETSNGNMVKESFDSVIVTTHSFMVKNIVPGFPIWYKTQLEKTKYLSAVLLILLLDRPLSEVYWLNVADSEIPFVGVIEHTNLIPPKHYRNQHIVYISNYLSREDPLFDLSHKELLQAYLPHIKKINSDFKESWIVKSHYQKINAAQPVIGTNYSDDILDHRTPLSGIYLANTTQVYPQDRGTNYSVRLGRRVAGMVMDDLG